MYATQGRAAKVVARWWIDGWKGIGDQREDGEPGTDISRRRRIDRGGYRITREIKVKHEDAVAANARAAGGDALYVFC